MKWLLVGLLLLSSCSSIQETDQRILVSIQSPEEIKTIGARYGLNSALGLAFPYRKPCEIVVPSLNRSTIWIWQHELRHCREGSFHK